MMKVCSLWRVKRVILFIFVATLTCTNQDVYLIYSNEHQYGIDAYFMGTMLTICSFGATFWLVMYNSTFVNVRNRWFILCAYLFRFFGNNMMAMSVRTGLDPMTAKLW